MSVCIYCGLDSAATIAWSAAVHLPMKWVSQNELGSNTRYGAGFKYRKVRKLAESMLSRYASEIHGATMPRRVHFTRMYGTRCRPYDYANMVGGGKPIVDALVNCGLLLDDNPTVFQASYHQERATRLEGIRLLFEEVSNG